MIVDIYCSGTTKAGKPCKHMIRGPAGKKWYCADHERKLFYLQLASLL